MPEDIVEEPLPPAFMRYRRATTGPYARLTTTELIAVAAMGKYRLATDEGRSIYNDVVDEFYHRWQPWIDFRIRKVSPQGPRGDAFRTELASAVGLKLAYRLAEFEQPKAWGSYIETLITTTSLDITRKDKATKRQMDREATSLDDMNPGQEPRQYQQDGDREVYSKVRLEVLVLSGHDTRPLEAVDRRFFNGESTEQIGTAFHVPARKAEQIVKQGCEYMAVALEQEGWHKLAAEFRLRAKSLKGTKQ